MFIILYKSMDLQFQINLHIGLVKAAETDTALSTSGGGQAERKELTINNFQNMLFKQPRKYLFPGNIIRILRLDVNSDLPGSVLVNASWYSGGPLHVDANACSSAEVAMAWSNNL